jgi:hypothetical protein
VFFDISNKRIRGKMGWFKKGAKAPSKKDVKSKKEEENTGIDELPTLPEIPELPDISQLSTQSGMEKPQQLPKYPNDDFGNQMSQRSIKDVVLGPPDIPKEVNVAMQQRVKPPFSPKMRMTREIGAKSIQGIALRGKTQKNDEEPLFVRIDKFEDAIKRFEDIKDKLKDAERMLGQVQQIKKQEEEELVSWEVELQTLKSQIDSLDEEIFSKI